MRLFRIFPDVRIFGENFRIFCETYSIFPEDFLVLKLFLSFQNDLCNLKPSYSNKSISQFWIASYISNVYECFVDFSFSWSLTPAIFMKGKWNMQRNMLEFHMASQWIMYSCWDSECKNNIHVFTAKCQIPAVWCRLPHMLGSIISEFQWTDLIFGSTLMTVTQ